MRVALAGKVRWTVAKLGVVAEPENGFAVAGNRCGVVGGRVVEAEVGSGS